MLHFYGVVVDNSIAAHARLVHTVCQLEGSEQIDCGECCVLESRTALAEHILVEHEVGGEEESKSLEVHHFWELVRTAQSGVVCVSHLNFN